MYKLVKGILSVYIHLFLKLKVSGAENIPSEGGGIICANHIHLLDPFAVGINTKRVISFMAKKEIFKSKIGAWFFTKLHAIPVNRDGNDAYSLKKALGVINSNELLGIFPEGTREKEGKTLKFKPGVSMLSIKTQTPLIPVFIEGSYKPFSTLCVTIGSPIDLSDYYGKKLSADEYSFIANNIIENEILSLKGKNL